jgi:hypothetical protein
MIIAAKVYEKALHPRLIKWQLAKLFHLAGLGIAGLAQPDSGTYLPKVLHNRYSEVDSETSWSIRYWVICNPLPTSWTIGPAVQGNWDEFGAHFPSPN